MGRGHVKGALAGHAVGFRAQLLAEGYRDGSAARLVHLMAHLSRWMDYTGVMASDLTPTVIEQFVAVRRGEGYVGWRTPRALAPLVGYLRGIVQQHRHAVGAAVPVRGTAETVAGVRPGGLAGGLVTGHPATPRRRR